MNIDKDYDKIISDKKIFYETIYTPLSEAIRLLEERKKDNKLKEKIENLLGGHIPDIFKGEKKCFQFRQIATPNYEGQWFLKIAKSFNLNPNFCEFHDDKFTTNNNFKLSLGNIKIHHGFDKNGNLLQENIKIIDIKKNDGKKLREINTIWSESLIDFHRKLFELYGFDMSNINFSDLSSWHNRIGTNSLEIYVNIFLICTTHGILFENFLTYNKEGEFSKRNILPALNKVMKITNLKPLIVPIPPMDQEYDDFIVYHSPIIKKVIPI